MAEQSLPEFTGYTPGPWEADGAVDTSTSARSLASGVRRRYHEITAHPPGWDIPACVCTTIERDRDIGNDEDTANAALIAAAPLLAGEVDRLREELSIQQVEHAAYRKTAEEVTAALRDRLPSQLPDLIEVAVAEETDGVPDWDPFITALQGSLSVEAVKEMEAALTQDNWFTEGPGTYLCKPFYEEGQRGDEGRWELAPGWGFTDIRKIAEPPAEPGEGR